MENNGCLFFLIVTILTIAISRGTFSNTKVINNANPVMEEINPIRELEELAQILKSFGNYSGLILFSRIGSGDYMYPLSDLYTADIVELLKRSFYWVEYKNEIEGRSYMTNVNYRVTINNYYNNGTIINGISTIPDFLKDKLIVDTNITFRRYFR